MIRITSALGLALSAACSVSDDVEKESENEQSILSANEYAAWAVWDGSLDHNRSYNSTDPLHADAGMTATNPATGMYSLKILNITSTTGNPVVTAIGSNSVRCKVAGVYSISGGIEIVIYCHVAGGTLLTNSAWSLSYAKFAGGTAYSTLGAYVYMNQPTGVGSLDSTKMWGDNVTVSSGGTGVYTLTFPNQIFTGGNFEVTSAGSNSDYCKIRSWPVWPLIGHTATVACYRYDGAPIATTFYLRYTRASSACNTPHIHDSYRGSGAYAWVRGTTPPTVDSHYTFNFMTGTTCTCDGVGVNTVEKKGPGQYLVTFPQFAGLAFPPPRQTTIVTAKGVDAVYCKIHDQGQNASEAFTEVWCYDATGATNVDSDFLIVLFSNQSAEC
jgi:hypothetical protein